MIIDTHAHYDDEQFNEDRDALLLSMAEGGIEKIVNIGASMASSHSTVELTKKYDFIYGAVGVHPEYYFEVTDQAIEELRGLAKNNEKIVMIGEIGLDYYWDKEHNAEQQEAFRKQLRLAVELDLPVSIHSRDAAEDTFNILQEEVEAARKEGHELKGIIHCFSYGIEMAERFLKLGFWLGIGGVVTFKNAKKLKEVAERVDIGKILLETDAPYMAPEPNRGKRNSSLYLPFVAAEIARLKGMEADEVADITKENAKKLLGIN